MASYRTVADAEIWGASLGASQEHFFAPKIKILEVHSTAGISGESMGGRYLDKCLIGVASDTDPKTTEAAKDQVVFNPPTPAFLIAQLKDGQRL